MKTVVGIYSSLAEANEVKAALQTEGYEATHIKVIDQSSETLPGSADKDQPFAEKVKNFFTGLVEHADEHAHYASRVKNGSTLLAVTVPDEEADDTADLLSAHGATGIEGDYAATQAVDKTAPSTSVKDYAVGTAIAGEQVIPIVQEELVVGKRQVDRGGVRIYSHVVETPVYANVSLHNERVVVDRRPVDRAAVDADFLTGSEVIEVNALGEEAAVGKSSRVVEEVRVSKEGSEHTEQIQDTVRRTEVDIEPTATLDASKH